MNNTSELQFHDIKPLLGYYYLPIWLWLCLGLIFIITCYYLYRRSFVKNKKNTFLPQLTPLEIANENLCELEKLSKEHRIPVSTLSSRLSLTLREYLGASFNLNATELTATELANALGNKDNCTLSEQLRKEIYQHIKFLEKISFANDSAKLYTLDSNEVQHALTKTKQQIEEIANNVQNLLATNELVTKA